MFVWNQRNSRSHCPMLHKCSKTCMVNTIYPTILWEMPICLAHSKENKWRSALSLSPFSFIFYDSQTPQLWKGVRTPSGVIRITSSPHPTFARRFHFKSFLRSSPPRADQERYSCIHPLCGSVVCAGMLFSLYCEWPLWSNYWQEDEVVPLFQPWWLNLLSTARRKGPCLILSKLTDNRDVIQTASGRYNNLGMHR